MADQQPDDYRLSSDGDPYILDVYNMTDDDDNYFDNRKIPYYASVYGTNSPDTIKGVGASIYRDTMQDMPLEDYIVGNGGDDSIRGYNGNDDLYGNSGNDTLIGDRDRDYLNGGPDDDELHGYDGDDELDGGTGNDKLYGDGGYDGDNGDDTLFGNDGNDNLYGGKGSDFLDGGKDHDVIGVTAYKEDENLVYGGEGNDLFIINADTSQPLHIPGADAGQFAYDGILTNATDLTVSVIKTLAKTSLKTMPVTSLALEVFKETLPAFKNIFDTYVWGNSSSSTIEIPSRIEDANSVIVADFDPTRDMMFMPLGSDGNVNVTTIPESIISTEYNISVDGFQFKDSDGAVIASIAGDAFKSNTYGSGSTVNEDVARQTWNNRLTVFNDGTMTIGTGGDYNSTQVPDLLRDELDVDSQDAGITGYIFLGAYGPRELYGDPAQGGIDYLFGTQVYGDFLHGFPQDLDSHSSDAEDRLFGYGGDDNLYGSNKDDKLYGGDGSDTAIYQDLDSGIKAFLTDDSAKNGNSLKSVSSVTDNGIISSTTDPLSGLHAVNAFGQDEALGDALLGAVEKSDGIDSVYSIENIVGTYFDDEIEGNSLDNTFTGLGGNDILKGKGGSDTVDYSYTTAGVQVILNANDDVAVTVTKMAAERGEAQSQEYTETIYGFENVIGSDHADTVNGTNEANVIEGGDGDDSLRGVFGNDTLDGGDGDDTLHGGNGQDIVNGGNGQDNMNGAGGNDTVNGGNGNDTATGGNSDDIVNGGDGDDIVNGDDGKDTLDGGNGNDTLDGGKGSDIVLGDNDNDFLYGNNGNDTLDGGNGNDTLEGGVGNDTLISAVGNNTYLFDTDDALGSDTIEHRNSDSEYRITLDFSSTTNTNNNIEINLTETSSQVVNSNLTLSVDGELVDDVQGTAGDDTITGNSKNNVLAGNDGDDQLTSGWGIDILTGGNGADTFYLNVDLSSNSKDIITDFDPATDKIGIDILKNSDGSTPDFILSDALLSTSQSGSDLILSYQGSDFAVLEGVSSSDFIPLTHVEGLFDSSIFTDALGAMQSSPGISGTSISWTPIWGSNLPDLSGLFGSSSNSSPSLAGNWG
ncbi:MAG: calcium-binding protein [Cyanobacteria bacterium P01_H01_bin.35]